MSNAYFHKGKPISQASNSSDEISYKKKTVKDELDSLNNSVTTITSNISTIKNTLDNDISTLNNTLQNKQSTITGGATTITSSNLTSNRALISNGTGKVAVSAVTNTELGYLDGVTSNIQTQLNGKQNTSTAITTTNIANQSVKYATTAGSAPANGGNAATVGGYSADGLKVKFYIISLNNVACTTRSSRGAYYSGILDTITNHGITEDQIIGITIINWGGAVASFIPYYQANVLRIMSDISQTISAIGLKVAYITY